MRTLAAIRRETIARWGEIVAAANLDSRGTLRAIESLPLTPTLLGSSTKVELGNGIGVLSAVVYLAPFSMAGGATLCPDSTPTCRALCLGHRTGRLAMAPARKAQAWKTALYLGHRALFSELLLAESAAHARKARKMGKIPAVRVDGSSDTGLGQDLAGPLVAVGARPYDYTKSPARALEVARGGAPGYSLTFSHSGPESLADSLAVLRAGGSVAVVGQGEEVPEEWMGFTVIDGDAHDARFLDRELGAPAAGGFVVWLKLKTSGMSRAQRDKARRAGARSGFAALAP